MRVKLAVLAGTLAVGLATVRRPELLRDDDPSYDPYHPGVDITYTLSVSSTQVNLGDNVTVTWNGAKSHPNDLQDWDWVAGFQVGACNVSGFAGEDTCYAVNQWAWLTDQGSDDNTGSWTFTFDGPGLYEFRVSYCGCTECNDVTADFSACSGYATVGVSPSVNVLPPIDLSPFSKDVQFMLGLLWFEFEGSQSSMGSLLNQNAPESCTSCLCTVEEVIKQMDETVGDFELLWHNFSMSTLGTTIDGVAESVEAMKAAFTDCDVDQIVGSDITAELMTAAAGLVSGLDEVEMVVKMAIDGTNIYSSASNAILGWLQQNLFASGVNTGRLLNLLLAKQDLAKPEVAAAVMATAHKAGVTSMARRPGGVWVPCDALAVPSRHAAVCIPLDL